MKTCVLGAALLAAAASGCGRRGDLAPHNDVKQVVVWHTLGTWSGRGSRQTESVTSDSGAMRVRWTAVKNESGKDGHFRVAAHSAISGRFLEQAVDHDGPGSGVGFVNQDPRVFYFVVESDRLDWTFSVEEAIAGTVTGR